ncbi:hypothetical protein P389DRAFT_10874 [Cystobasidium minutum MCA 4210]|uniref:uncharacterized protein n=1 Tax=Cystobasidium minutum MCA 4210 TaxID=1397322 RepID=UPI0034CFC681|eukprot:jgi/Rhomi1/10874/CE10873_391
MPSRTDNSVQANGNPRASGRTSATRARGGISPRQSRSRGSSSARPEYHDALLETATRRSQSPAPPHLSHLRYISGEPVTFKEFGRAYATENRNTGVHLVDPKTYTRDSLRWVEDGPEIAWPEKYDFRECCKDYLMRVETKVEGGPNRKLTTEEHYRYLEQACAEYDSFFLARRMARGESTT